MSTDSTKRPVAGIDVSKGRLDVAVRREDPSVSVAERFSDTNDEAGWTRIAARLAALDVERVGLEASGHYEAGVTASLRAGGFTVLVLDPRQVHGFRRFRQKRAKTDTIDAELIAAVTAAIGAVRAPPDPRLAPLAEHLTLIDAITEDIARQKTRRDRFTDPAHRGYIDAEIQRLTAQRLDQIAALQARVEAEPDLARRLHLLQTIPAIGILTALAFVVRMPELGRMTREQAAALVGVAPFNDDTGQTQGQRHIAGGRKRLRRLVFLAAFAGAVRWNPILVALYQRLRAAGKHHTLAIVACARKLVEIANAVLARDTQWTTDKPANPAAMQNATA